MAPTRQERGCGRWSASVVLGVVRRRSRALRTVPAKRVDGGKAPQAAGPATCWPSGCPGVGWLRRVLGCRRQARPQPQAPGFTGWTVSRETAGWRRGGNAGGRDGWTAWRPQRWGLADGDGWLRGALGSCVRSRPQPQAPGFTGWTVSREAAGWRRRGPRHDHGAAGTKGPRGVRGGGLGGRGGRQSETGALARRQDQESPRRFTRNCLSTCPRSQADGGVNRW
jgi:hypothetical protein